MALSNADHNSSSAPSERSLLRSLSAIHIHRPAAPRSSSPTDVRVSLDSDFDLPPLPFCRQPQSNHCLLSGVGCLPKKLQRRQRVSPITTGATEPLTPKLTRGGRRERRRMMDATINSNVGTSAKSPRRVTFDLSSPSSCSVDEKRTIEAQHSTGFRGDYSLGETLRSPSHVMAEPTSEQAIRAVNSLNQHDFAFVKRSDGSYSYAILADRSMERSKCKGVSNKDDADSVEEFMTFVMSDLGATKMIPKRHWNKSVRLVRL